MEQLQNGRQPSAGAKAGHHVALQMIVTLIVVAVVFAGVEYAVRASQYRKFGPRSLHSIALRDRFTAWRNNPAYGRVDRQINAQGFRRDQDVPLEKPPNTVRIFLTGGSVAYGFTTGWPQIDNHFEHLYNNQTISYYLEQELNDLFPSKHWEVINAAVVGYQLNLELAQTESVLLRYQPDGIIYLDGHNDLLSLLHNAGRNYDPYVSTPTGQEFDLLANPGSFNSLLFFLAAWSRENSALIRLASDRLQAVEEPAYKTEAGARAVNKPVRLSDLTLAESARFNLAQGEMPFYPHLARQAHRILDLDGVKAIFLLQPELFLTRKPMTPTEQRLLDYQRHNPALLLYAFQELYPEIGTRMAAAAQQDGFVFENLTGLFDQTSAQAFTDDCHLTPDGNRAVAERLLKLLEGMFVDRQAKAG